MNAKTFFIAHGEKLAVAVVAIACALALWSTATDKAYQPVKNAETVVQINERIEKVLRTQQTPVLKEPRPFLDQLLARLAQAVPTTPVMAWLLAPPDVSKIPPKDAFIYVYEILTPTVKLEDSVGQLMVDVSLPVGDTSAEGRRFSNERSKTWRRTEKVTIVNTARHLGVQLEVRVGDGADFKPLVLPGSTPEGVLPLTAVNGAVTIPAIEPWQMHRVRARIIACATALVDEDRPRQTVVVFGRTVAPASPSDDMKVIESLKAQLRTRSGPLYNDMLPPAAGPVPPGAQLVPGERIFIGPWSDEAEVRVTGDVRFTFDRVVTEPDAKDPTKSIDKVRLLVMKLFQQGTEKKWLQQPVALVLAPGDKLVATVKVSNPFGGKDIMTTIETPFVVQKLLREQPRIYYYFIKPKGKPTGGHDKDLFLDKKDKLTDIVVLLNPITEKTLSLAKLATIDPPASGVVMFPYRPAQYVEKDEFIKAPNLFNQVDPIPPEPKAFQPDTGPLAALYEQRKAADDLEAENYRTNTAYYVLADGRMVWWDPIRHEMRGHDPRGILKAQPTTPVVPPPAPAPEAPAPKPAPPVGNPPPGVNPATPPTPPGAMPPGAMPPGATPPGGAPQVPGAPAPQRPR